MKTEAEIRQQLTETRAVIAQLETQLNAAANQEWALRFVLGEVDTPTAPEPPVDAPKDDAPRSDVVPPPDDEPERVVEPEAQP